jgi:hypothetical protein
MAKTLEKFVESIENSTGKPRSSSEDFISVIQRVIDLALQKYESSYTKNSEKIRWGRLLVAASSAADTILDDGDLEKRIEVIEELLNEKTST